MVVAPVVSLSVEALSCYVAQSGHACPLSLFGHCHVTYFKVVAPALRAIDHWK